MSETGIPLAEQCRSVHYEPFGDQRLGLGGGGAQRCVECGHVINDPGGRARAHRPADAEAAS